MAYERAATGGSGTNQIADWNSVGIMGGSSGYIARVFGPLTHAAMAAAAPISGERVIEVGWGCCSTVLELGRLVGPDGQVLGIDVSQPMAACPRVRIAEAGLADAGVAVVDAATCTLPAAEAGILFSRFVVMFPFRPCGSIRQFTSGDPARWPDAVRCLAAIGRQPVVYRAASGRWRPVAAAVSVRAECARPYAFADGHRVGRILSDAGWHTWTWSGGTCRCASPERGRSMKRWSSRHGLIRLLWDWRRSIQNCG